MKRSRPWVPTSSRSAPATSGTPPHSCATSRSRTSYWSTTTPLAAQAASIESASWFRLLHPRTWKATRATSKRGYHVHKSGKRVTQLGATFVIGPGVMVRYEHLDADSTDHAPVDTVIEVFARDDDLMPVRAVIFDFYGTLAESTGAGLAWADLFSEIGHTVSQEAIDRLWNQGNDGVEHVEHSQSREHYVAWQQARLRQIIAESGVPEGDDDLLFARMSELLGTQDLAAYPESGEVLAELRDPVSPSRSVPTGTGTCWRRSTTRA